MSSGRFAWATPIRCGGMRPFLSWTVLITALALLAGACGAGAGAPTGNPVLDGAGEVAAGEELFQANCAACHGVDADGTDQGPSFLSDVYEPGHHADGAFLIAARNGVQAHHWDFGPMPPVEGLSDGDLADIVAWVRQQQRAAG